MKYTDSSIAARKIMLLKSYIHLFIESLWIIAFFRYVISRYAISLHCPWHLLAWIVLKCITSAAGRAQSLARHPRLSRHVSRGVNCHPQHASVTCPLSERASVLFWELLSANQRVSRVVRRTEVSPAIIYLSVPGPGIRETLSLTAGSPSVRSFVRLRAERYLLSARTSTPNTLSG